MRKIAAAIGVLLIQACGVAGTTGAMGQIDPPVVASPLDGAFGHIVEAEIGVRDSAGRVRNGIALTRGAFPQGFSEHVSKLSVRLASEAAAIGDPQGNTEQTLSFDERRAAAIASMERLVRDEGAVDAFAFVFVDADVTGWTGPVLSVAQSPDEHVSPGVIKSKLDLAYPGQLNTWYGGQVASSAQYYCMGAQDYGAVANYAGCPTPNTMRFYGPSSILFSPTYNIGTDAPLYGWGYRSNGWGYYKVTLTQGLDNCFNTVNHTLVCTI